MVYQGRLDRLELLDRPEALARAEQVKKFIPIFSNSLFELIHLNFFLAGVPGTPGTPGVPASRSATITTTAAAPSGGRFLTI